MASYALGARAINSDGSSRAEISSSTNGYTAAGSRSAWSAWCSATRPRADPNTERSPELVHHPGEHVASGLAPRGVTGAARGLRAAERLLDQRWPEHEPVMPRTLHGEPTAGNSGAMSTVRATPRMANASAPPSSDTSRQIPVDILPAVRRNPPASTATPVPLILRDESAGRNPSRLRETERCVTAPPENPTLATRWIHVERETRKVRLRNVASTAIAPDRVSPTSCTDLCQCRRRP